MNELVIYDLPSLVNHTHANNHDPDSHSGTMILFISLSCLMGALLRTLLKETGVPFTVVIFLLGVALGVLSSLVVEVSKYTLMSTIDPHLMLHLFLPVLVFDSAYALETHTLLKSFSQVAILSVLGFMFSAFLTVMLVMFIFPYGWSWYISMAFGTIVSATDPVAVVASLKELGTDKRLAMLLEGESLLNDGTALVFFTVFLQAAKGEHTDANAEAGFGVSGVLSVVVLGAILSSEKTSISPEVEKFLSSSDSCESLDEWNDEFSSPSFFSQPLHSTEEDLPTAATSLSQNQVVCPDFSSHIKAELTGNQYKEYEEEARIRYLKAQKISYWRQFEKGLLGKAPVRKLIELTESAADKVGAFVALEDISLAWKLRGVGKLYPIISRILTKLCSTLIPKPIPRDLSRRLMFQLAISRGFKVMVMVILIGEVILGATDLLLFINDYHHHILFFAITIVCTLFFTIEFCTKVAGFGLKLYSFNFWNVVAALSLLAAYPELYTAYELERHWNNGNLDTAKQYHMTSVIIRLCRGIRLLETFIENVLPALKDFVDKRVESQLNFGYGVGRGFVVGEEECRQLLDHIVEDPRMRSEFKNNCDKSRLAIIKELALLQKNNPGVAVAVKTRQATRTVLNKITETLLKLKEDGLIDEAEAEKLHLITDKLIKMQVSTPPSIPPMPADHMLSFVPWLQGADNSVAKFMKQRAQLINFDHGDIIIKLGEASKGVYIVVSGLVKIHGRQRLHSHFPSDADPISPEELAVTSPDRYTDYLGAGSVLGGVGPLMETQKIMQVTAETAVQMYFLNTLDLELAFDMYPEVKLKLWKHFSVRTILSLLAEHKEFQSIPNEAVRVYFEKGYIPVINEQTVYNIDDDISDAFLIRGRVKVLSQASLRLTGPTCIPPSIRVIQFMNPQETILYLVPANENSTIAVNSFHEGIRNRLNAYASEMGQRLLKTSGSDTAAMKRKPVLYDVAKSIIEGNIFKKRNTMRSSINTIETIDEGKTNVSSKSVKHRPSSIGNQSNLVKLQARVYFILVVGVIPLKPLAISIIVTYWMVKNKK